MVRLNTFDAGVLARVATGKRFAADRRYRMLRNAGPEAKEIGDIIISGHRDGKTNDFLEAADDINRWAGVHTEAYAR